MQSAATMVESWFQRLGMWKSDRQGNLVLNKEGHRIPSQLGLDRMVHSAGHGGPYYYDDPQPIIFKTILVFSRLVPALVEAKVLIVNDPKRKIGPGLATYSTSKAKAKAKAKAIDEACDSDSDSDF